MTRFDTFILLAFLILLLVRFVLAYGTVRSRSFQIHPWAMLAGQRTPRGKGVTLLVQGRWLMGTVYGQHSTGTVVIRTSDGGFEEVAPEDIKTVRVFDP